jgi:hypothetical protein
MSSDRISISEELLLHVREALGPGVSIDALHRRGDMYEGQGDEEGAVDAHDGGSAIDESEGRGEEAPAISQEEDENGDFLFTVHLHGAHCVQLSTAEDDFNKDKKTLFATHIWNGSTVLANYIIDHIGSDVVASSSVVELGAGAGLPSMLCAR